MHNYNSSWTKEFCNHNKTVVILVHVSGNQSQCDVEGVRTAREEP